MAHSSVTLCRPDSVRSFGIEQKSEGKWSGSLENASVPLVSERASDCIVMSALSVPAYIRLFLWAV